LLAAIAAVALLSVAVPSAAGPAGPAAVEHAAARTRRAIDAGTPLVRLPFPQEDGTLTPYSFELGYPLVSLIYDTLLWRDEHGVPKPWLARSVEVSADGLSVTAHLAQDARWQDGLPLTSSDVAFTYAFVAEHPHARFTPELEAVERVDTPDRATAVIRLRHPAAGFDDQPLADVPILPAHLWADLPAGQPTPAGLPIGSGPYRLVDHVAGDRYRFEANDDYFLGPPRVAALEVPIIRTAEDTVHALEARDIDAIPASLPSDAAARAEQLGIATKLGPSYLGTVLFFNVRRAPFDQPELRRAVAQALDLDRIQQLVTPGVSARHGLVHPDSPWATTAVLQGTDEAAARARVSTLAPGALEVLAPDNDPTKVEAARQVALALVRVGLDAHSRTVPKVDLEAAMGRNGTEPTFQAAIGSSPPLASYDPNVVGRLFGSGPADAPLNVTGYANANFDALATQVAINVDHGQRQTAIDAELALLAADAPAVPLFFATGTYAVRPDVYDHWVFVKGAGIFDKLSFLDIGTSPDSTADPTTSPLPAVRPSRPGSDSFPLDRIALGLLVLAAAFGVAGIARRQS